MRAGRVLPLAPPRRPGPTRSAPRASALPHAPLLASHTPLARKLFQNFCEARYRFSIRFFSPLVPLSVRRLPPLTPLLLSWSSVSRGTCRVVLTPFPHHCSSLPCVPWILLSPPLLSIQPHHLFLLPPTPSSQRPDVCF